MTCIMHRHTRTCICHMHSDLCTHAPRHQRQCAHAACHMQTQRATHTATMLWDKGSKIMQTRVRARARKRARTQRPKTCTIHRRMRERSCCLKSKGIRPKETLHTPAHAHARTHARTYARTHASTHARARARTHTHTHVPTNARTHIHAQMYSLAPLHSVCFRSHMPAPDLRGARLEPATCEREMTSRARAHTFERAHTQMQAHTKQQRGR